MSDSKVNDGKKVTVLICISGLTGAVFFLMVGYWVAGVMAAGGENPGTFTQRIVSVLKNPFSNYFNTYTPIVMLIAAVVFEFLFFLLLVGLRKYKRNRYMIEHPRESVGLPGNDFYDEGNGESGTMAEEREASEEDSQEGMPLSQEICLGLMNKDYTMEQIIEMAELEKYMPGINTELLIKMFDVSMSAKDIREYIEIFYK